MTRAEKSLKRIKRAQKRRLHHKDRTRESWDKIQKVIDEYGLSVWQAKNHLRWGCWSDSYSETGYTQICDYQTSYGTNTCDSPCNGDC